MILKLARKLTSKIYPEINVEQADLYAYGFFILISKGLSLVEVLLCGIILHNVWHAILFYFVFTPLREYSGGIHARKEKTCIFCTALALFLSIAGIKLLEVTVGCVIQSALLIIGTSAVFHFSPMDTQEKPLDEDGHVLFGQKSKCLCIVADLFAVLSYLIGFRGIMNAVSMALALEGILLIAGGLQRELYFYEQIN